VLYRFGDFTLNGQTRQLAGHGGEIHLSPKAFELLTLLIDNRERAMSKNELQDRVWPATFVQETSVAGLVNEIRRALSDPAPNPRFVRTVHRFGYRFIGTVTTDDPVADSRLPAARFYLAVERRRVILIEGASVIGRAQDATIPIDSPGVSRAHARIVVSGGRAVIEDLGSKNGTYVGGERISEPAELSDGQQVKVGAVVLTFHTAAPAGVTDTLPGAQSSQGAHKPV